MELKDSGERREFDSGAVRDISEGKGRCDLLPLDIISQYMSDIVLSYIADFKATGCCQSLWDALNIFQYEAYAIKGLKDSRQQWANTLLEVSIHFEDGARKYGENNWQKGIPLHCYIDSAIRHYLKWRRRDKDEPHDRAFVWNILCAIWTMHHFPNLIDITFDSEKEDESCVE